MKNAHSLRGFTLIELLVVIGIIAILAAVLIGTFSGSTESARAARCLTNMRNLAAACQSYGMVNEYYPCAGSREYRTYSTDRNRKLVTTYTEVHGWVSPNTKGYYPTTSSKLGSIANVSMYEENQDVRDYCLTNGALWKYVSGAHSTYVCPTHAKTMSKYNPNWSYVMNAYFGCSKKDTSVYYGALQRADRILLFAEIPFAGIGETANTTRSPGDACDGILQYSGAYSGSSSESVGFNHKVGKLTYANVVFADGHVEKLVYPKSGFDRTDMQKLTKWLCEGTDVSFDGKQYKEMTN